MKIDTKAEIFICDDDKGLNALIKTYLSKQGFKNISSFYTGEDTVKSADKKPIVVIQDFDLPGINGLETMKQFKEKSPDTEFIFLSGQESIKTAVDVMHNGAFDYIVKDSFAPENAFHKILKVLKIKKLSTDKQSFKIGVFMFGALFVISWIIFFILFFNK